MSVTICVGGGAFGAKAAKECQRKGSRVLVIDIDEHCLASTVADETIQDADQVLRAPPGTIMLLVGDGASIIDRTLERWLPDLLVPASRGHFAAHLAVEHCQRRGRELEPATLERVLRALPRSSVQLADQKSGVIVTSYMRSEGTCLEECEQPLTCPVTGRTSPMPMFRSIEMALSSSVDLPLVLRTFGTGQFGGIRGQDLDAMLASIDGLRGGETCGIATACRCHGITNVLRLTD